MFPYLWKSSPLNTPWNKYGQVEVYYIPEFLIAQSFIYQNIAVPYLSPKSADLICRAVGPRSPHFIMPKVSPSKWRQIAVQKGTNPHEQNRTPRPSNYKADACSYYLQLIYLSSSPSPSSSSALSNSASEASSLSAPPWLPSDPSPLRSPPVSSSSSLSS